MVLGSDFLLIDEFASGQLIHHLTLKTVHGLSDKIGNGSGLPGVHRCSDSGKIWIRSCRGLKLVSGRYRRSVATGRGGYGANLRISP